MKLNDCVKTLHILLDFMAEADPEVFNLQEEIGEVAESLQQLVSDLERAQAEVSDLQGDAANTLDLLITLIEDDILEVTQE